MRIKVFVFNPVEVNTYLLYDETKEAAIIDCGAYTEKEYKELNDYIESNGLTIKYLLNTHLHFDHILGDQHIYEKYGIKPMYHQEEELLPGIKTQLDSFHLPLNCKPVHADKFINEGDIIQFGNIKLKAILTPGHSPASLSYYVEDENCVFTGDALFQHSIGRTDLWGGNTDTLVGNIKNKLMVMPENTVVYPGHGFSTTIGEEKRNNPYLQ